MPGYHGRPLKRPLPGVAKADKNLRVVLTLVHLSAFRPSSERSLV